MRLLEELATAIGADRVRACEKGDPEARTAAHVSGRSIGTPLAWVRPADTAQVAAVLSRAAAARVRVVPVGDATTFWDGLWLEGAIALDVRGLDAPFHIDAQRRLALVGAGVNARAVDQAARREGLCLPALPDASGETPVGSILAVGSTAGLGMGRCLPIETIAGATAVTGSGQILRVGASHAIASRAYVAEGRPDLLSLLTAAEGEAAVITEVGLRLEPAPYTCDAWLRWDGTLDASAMLAALRGVRARLDRGRIETARLEAVDDRVPELLLRTCSLDGAAEAQAEATRTLDGFSSLRVVPESEDSRRGITPAYDARYTVPPGQHRARLEGLAFWGAEVNVSWGDEARDCLARLFRLFDESKRLALGHRRLAIYPARHLLSIGVQVLVERSPAQVERARALVADTLPELLALGAVPYRRGRLWAEALAQHDATRGDASTRLVERCLDVLDPDGIVAPAGLTRRP